MLKLSLVALAGAVLGVAATLLVSGTTGPGGSPEAQVVVVQPRDRRAMAAQPGWDEQRVARLEAALLTKADRPTESGDAKERVAPEEARALEASAQQARLAAHAAEPRDVRWASNEEGEIQEELDQQAGEQGFVVRDVDCRSTSCVASLDWGSRATAEDAVKTVVESTHASHCMRTLYLPPASDGAGYTTQLVLQCSRSEAE